MRRSAPKCAGIRGCVGVHLGVHFRNVGVHWVLYPHATSHPAAPALRMPAAAPMPPPGKPDTRQQRQQWHTRNNATAHRHKPPMGLQHNTTPLGHTPQQSGGAARITRKPTPQGEPSRLHFVPRTHRQSPQAPVPNPSGYDHFYRGHRGQTVTTALTYCHH